jgi:N-acetylglucosamine-6-phosphate deacetylase
VTTPTTITAAHVVTPQRTLDNAAVTVVGGRISAIAPCPSAPQYHLVTAGFVDIQVNGHSDVDVATVTPADWPRINSMLLSQGVTAWCPTLITSTRQHYAERLALLQRLAETGGPGPRVLGVHLEGPYLGTRHGAHVGVPDGPIDLAWLAELPDIVRIMTLGPERPNAIEAIGLLRDKGITVALGHTAATYEQTIAAIEAGATLFTHCFNATAALHHRQPGPMGAALTDDRIAVSVIADGVHLHPAIVQLAFAAKPHGKTVLVTDASGWQTSKLSGANVTHRDGGPRLDDGTLAGSSLTMDQAVQNTVTDSAVALSTALQAASAAPANLVGRPDLGRVEIGAPADLVALNPEGSTCAAWVDGQLLHSVTSNDS